MKVELVALRRVAPRRAAQQWSRDLRRVKCPRDRPLNAGGVVAARQLPPYLGEFLMRLPCAICPADLDITYRSFIAASRLYKHHNEKSLGLVVF